MAAPVRFPPNRGFRPNANVAPYPQNRPWRTNSHLPPNPHFRQESPRVVGQTGLQGAFYDQNVTNNFKSFYQNQSPARPALIFSGPMEVGSIRSQFPPPHVQQPGNNLGIMSHRPNAPPPQTSLNSPSVISDQMRFPPPGFNDREVHNEHQTNTFIQYQFQSKHKDVSHRQETGIMTHPCISDATDKEFEEKHEDQAWLNRWVASRVQKNAASSDRTITISDAQTKTRELIVQLARLQKNRQLLETMKNEDSSIWDQKLKEVMKIKFDVEKLQNELTKETTVKQLQKLVERRRKKRARRKQLHKKEYLAKQKELSSRDELHAKIDKDMQKIVEQQRAKKQEEDMDKEADMILGQVRKKLSETGRYQQLLDSLSKLRRLRTDRLERQGVLSSIYAGTGSIGARNQVFENKISSLKELLDKQMNIYKAEESTLKVLLEKEQKETKEKEDAQTRQRRAEALEREHKIQHRKLFGKPKVAQPGDPIYSFQQFYESASHSLDNLVSVRMGWDMHLTLPDTPGASCIPDHWVVPEDPSSHAWASYLVTKSTTP